MNPRPKEGTTTDHRARLLRFRLRSQLLKNCHKSWIAAESVDVGIGLELVTGDEAGSDRQIQCLERAIDELLALREPFGWPCLYRMIPVEVISSDGQREGALQPIVRGGRVPAALRGHELEQVFRLGACGFGLPATGQDEHEFDRGVQVPGSGARV